MDGDSVVGLNSFLFRVTCGDGNISDGISDGRSDERSDGSLLGI
jgi:hypothetical protein